jgi:hypothetical protein
MANVNWTTVSQVVSFGAGVAAMLSLVMDVLGRTNQRPWSVQRVAGWLVVLLGLITAVASALWFSRLGVSAQDPSARGPLAAIAGAVLLTGVGIVRVWRAPVTREVDSLRVVARAVLASLGEPYDHPGRVEPVVTGGPDLATASRFRFQRRRRAAGADRVPAGITLLRGDPGSGRTSVLQWTAARIAREVLRRRRPRRMAVYVDLTGVDRGDALDADRIRSLITDTLSAGDQSIAAHVADNLREADSRVRWTFFVDSSGELPSPETGAGRWRAVERLLAIGGRASVVLAVDRPPAAAPLDVAVRVLDPLTRRQQARLAESAGVAGSVLAEIRRHGSLDPVLRNPRLLSMLCRALTAVPGACPRRLSEALDLIVDQALAGVAASEDERACARTAAAVLAYRQSAREPAVSADARPPSPELPGLLVRAGLLQPGLPDFVHPLLRAHLAAEAVISGAVPADPVALIVDPGLGAVSAAVIGRGPDELRDAVISAAADLLEACAVQTAGLVPDPAAVRSVASLHALPFGPMFAFPTESLRPLEVLSIAGRAGIDVPPLARRLADRFVASAVVFGTPYERRQAFAVLAAASEDVAVWLSELVLATGSEWLRGAAVEQGAALRWLFDRLSIRARLRAVIRVLTPSKHDPPPLDLAALPREGPGLAAVLGRLLLVARVAAVLFVIRASLHLAGALAGGQTTVSDTIYALVLIVFGLVFALGVERLPDRVRPDAAALELAAVLIFIGSWVLLGGIEAVSLVVRLGLWDLDGALRAAFDCYLDTWPAAMVGVLLLQGEPAPRDWWLPQLPVARWAWEMLTTEGRRPLDLLRATLSGRRPRTTPIPELRARLARGTLTGDDLLAWFDACTGKDDTAGLLRALWQAPPGRALADRGRADRPRSRDRARQPARPGGGEECDPSCSVGPRTEIRDECVPGVAGRVRPDAPR